MDKKLFFPALLFLFLGACSKEEFTKPADVNFVFQMNQQLNDGKFLRFEEGIYRFDKIEFDGERESGGDVFFISDFVNQISADLDDQTTNQPVTFDIPQGIYQKIELRFDTEIKAPDDHMMIFEGLFNSARRKREIPVRVEIDLSATIEVIAESKSGGLDIVLSQDKTNVAEVKIDPIFMFQLSNSRSLESADLIEENGEELILINENFNVVIYDRLINRLERATQVIFN